MDRPRDGVMEDLAVIAGLAVVIFGTWWLLGDELRIAAILASTVLSIPAASLADLLGHVTIPLLTPWLLAPSQAARDVLFSTPLGQLGQHGWALVPGGRNAALLAAPLLVMAARAALGLRVDLRYRTAHTLETATAEQARVWPAAARPLGRGAARDEQAETGVDAERALGLRSLGAHFHVIGGSAHMPPMMRPPAPAPDPLTPEQAQAVLRQRLSPAALATLENSEGWVPGGTLEEAAVMLAVTTRPDREEWREVMALLEAAGWRVTDDKDGWYDLLQALMAEERWEQGATAGYMAARSPIPPPTGSFLLPPHPVQDPPPPLGRALRPEEWLDRLLLRDEYGDVDQRAVEMCLAEQLTRPFSLAGMHMHERALAACIAAFRGDDSRQLIDDLARAFARCSAPGDVQRELQTNSALRGRIDKLIERHGKLLTSLANGHFWMETGLLEIWRAGREGGGILAPAAVLWLKSADRTLWYAVQCCAAGSGGGNVVIEAAGVHAHHRAEIQYGIPLPVPMLAEAAAALVNVYLDRSPDRHRAGQEY